MKRYTPALLALLLLAGCTAQPTPPPVQTPPPSQPAPEPASPAPRFTRLKMIDASTGWAWGGQGLFRTADGGETWTNVSPVTEGIGNGTPFAAYDAQTAWVGIGGGVYRTTDGGKTWQTAGLNGRDIGYLTFQDQQNGWAQVVYGHATGGTALTGLYRTSDGGATWTLVAENQVGEQALKNFPYAGMKSGVTFLDDHTGFATGNYSNVSRTFFYVTWDQGATWQEQTLPLPEVLTKPAADGEGLMGTVPPIITPDGALVLRVNSNRCSHGQGCAVIFISTDQGETWKPTSPLTHTVTAFDFVDASHGWASDGANIHTTADGGATWTTAALEKEITALEFVDAQTGFAVSHRGLHKTTDGGRTWTPAK